ncbi:MAG TPA: 3-deoxy-manno-octulosonate cytidylyltransferase [Vicinamibacterales bacterium]|nr:3-deoxy-manno-octulosonate cytidylyltransferase [Vicinamibacterales bacterium]
MPVVSTAELARSLHSARVVAVIPARFQSTRFPGKPLARLDARPMIEHVHQGATRARTVDAVVVATDDRRIAEAVHDFGGIAVMTRADHPTGTDRLAEVASALSCEVVVNVQGDEPLITGEAIDAAVELLAGRPTEVMGTLRRPLDQAGDRDNPDVVKVVVDAEGYALYFSRAALPFVRPGSPAPVTWRHVGLYCYRRAFLLELASLPRGPLEQVEALEQLRALEHGYRIRTAETAVNLIGVDTPADLERVRRQLHTSTRQ